MLYSLRIFKSHLQFWKNRRRPTFVRFHLRRKRLLGIRVGLWGLAGGWRGGFGGGGGSVCTVREKERQRREGGYRFPGGGWWGIDDRIASTPAEPITRLNLLSPLLFPTWNYISLAFITFVYPNTDQWHSRICDTSTAEYVKKCNVTINITKMRKKIDRLIWLT